MKPSEAIHYPPAFKTRSFYVRFRDEQVKLEDACQFRAEMDAEYAHNFEETDFFLEVELYSKKVRYAGTGKKTLDLAIESAGGDDFKVASK